jgi:hypothetical protein
MQYDNWLFGVQVVYFVPAACVVAGLLVAYSERMGTIARRHRLRVPVGGRHVLFG